MFVKLTNGKPSKYPYTLGELRRDNPQTSFPRKIPQSVLADYGVYAVVETVAPNFDSKSKRVVHEVQDINGVWTQQWRVENLPEDQARANNRAHRDCLLAETDWVVIMHTEKGTNIPAAMEIYRQALRDITSHANFPYLEETDWPVKP